MVAKDYNAAALPPLTLRSQVLSHALQRLRQNGPSSPTLHTDLIIALRLLIASHSRDLLPLTIVLYLDKRGDSLPLPLLLYATLTYHSHPLGALWDSQLDRQAELEEAIHTDVIPGLISRLRLAPGLATLGAAADTMLALSRANESLLALILSEADYILPALRVAYDDMAEGGVKVKMAVLQLCMALMGAVQSEGVKGGLRRLMGGEVLEAGDTCLFDQTLGLAIRSLEAGRVDEKAKRIMRDLRDEDARQDPRVQSILALFPALPPHLLLIALCNPALQPTGKKKGMTAEDQAAPLLEAILSGGSSLPSDLWQLKRAISNMAFDQAAGSSSAVPSTTPVVDTNRASSSAPPRPRRANIHDDLDISKLRLKSAEPETVSFDSIGRDMAPGMRENIMRLVQRQAEEAEEAARAVAEARGEKYVPEWKRQQDEEEAYIDDDGVKKVQGDGEESGDEMEGEVLVQKKKKTAQPVVHSYDPEIQTKLELAYLADPTVFDRDATTRRSGARSKLKERTGMDDAQLEGWKIMLERNPHKDAILARHTFVPQLNVDYVVSRPASEAPSGGSRTSRGGGNGGGGRGGRGRGNHTGSASGSRTPSEAGSSRGGRGGGGGGGGRGRGEHKGSRGHSNAARTRGHDKKMAKMGAGA